MLKSAAYACAAYSTLPRVLHRIRLRHSLGILMYHAVVEDPLAVSDWCFITAREFRQQMEYLHRYFRVLPLLEAVKELASGHISHPTIALTFDDGFQNNYDVALPILHDLGLPATVFLVTNLVGSNDTLWFCRLNQACIATRRQSLAWGGHEFSLRTRHDRARTSALLQSLLKNLPHDDMLARVEEIVIQLGSDPRESIDGGSPYRMLGAKSIKAMVDSGLIDFGAHTASHVILTQQPSHEQRRVEISRSIRETARLTGKPCRTFAYPNGRQEDYGIEAIELLQNEGIEAAVTTISGFNIKETLVLELRRYGIGADCTRSEFQCLVHHFDIGRMFPKRPQVMTSPLSRSALS